MTLFSGREQAWESSLWLLNCPYGTEQLDSQAPYSGPWHMVRWTFLSSLGTQSDRWTALSSPTTQSDGQLFHCWAHGQTALSPPGTHSHRRTALSSPSTHSDEQLYYHLVHSQTDSFLITQNRQTDGQLSHPCPVACQALLLIVFFFDPHLGLSPCLSQNPSCGIRQRVCQVHLNLLENMLVFQGRGKKEPCHF